MKIKRKKRKILMKNKLFLILFTIIVIKLNAFGAFNLFNQRNHPELEWKTIETENCQIVYHEPLHEFAVQSADIAQESFNTLSKSYKISPKDKMIIYISDQDNISNGAAVLTHYIFVWVNQNDFLKSFTGTDKWLRKVIAHEASHWFVFQSIKDWLYPVLPITAISFPGTLNEGYAQFFSGEPWGYNRGDRFLRTSVLSFKQKEPSGMYSGGLMYGAGFSMVRYLQVEYGEDKLMELLQFRNKSSLFNFEDAFKKVYHKSFKDFTEEWRRHIYTYYYAQAFNLKLKDDDPFSKNLTINSLKEFKSNWKDFKQMIWEKDKFLFVGRKSLNQGFYNLVLANVKSDSISKNNLYFEKEQIIAKSGNFSSISISNNQEWVAYSRYSRFEKGRFAPQVFLYSTETQKTRKFGEGNNVQVDNAGGVYYQRLDRDANNIYYICPLGNESLLSSFNKENQIGDLRLSPSSDLLALSLFDENQKFHIIVYNLTNYNAVSAIELPYMPQNFYWESEDRIIISSENAVNYQLSIFQYNIKSESLKEFQTPPFNMNPFKIETVNDSTFAYALNEYYRGGFTIGKAVIKEKNIEDTKVDQNYYTKWIDTKPQYMLNTTIASYSKSEPKDYSSIKNIKWRQGLAFPTNTHIFGTFTLSEALGKHILTGTGLIPYSSDNDPYWMLMYMNNNYTPSISLLAMQSKWVAGYYKDKLYFQDMKKVSLTATVPIESNIQYTNFNYGFGLHYSDISKDKDNELNLFEEKGFANTEAFIKLKYSLPWKNYQIHPVRSMQLNYSVSNATDKLGMSMNFTQHSTFFQNNYAPFLYLFKAEQLKTLSIRNTASYECITGDPLAQFMPGTDAYEYFQTGDSPAFNRFFIRGYENNHTAKRLLNNQNEICLKLTDSFLISDYVAVSAFLDYSKLWKVDMQNKETEYKAMGYEFKSKVNLFGLSVLAKYGFAYDLKGKKLNEYYLFSLPFGANEF